jgi:hypothetical protein
MFLWCSAQLWSTFVFCSPGSASGFVYLRVAEPQWVLNISWLNWVSGHGFRKAKVTPKKREKQIRWCWGLEASLGSFLTVHYRHNKISTAIFFILRPTSLDGSRSQTPVLSSFLLSRLSFGAPPCHITVDIFSCSCQLIVCSSIICRLILCLSRWKVASSAFSVRRSLWA